MVRERYAYTRWWSALAGAGNYVVEAVGSDSFAERLAAEAPGTAAQLSPLQRDVNHVLRATVSAMVPLAVLLVGVLALRETPLAEAGRTTVAALLPLVPEGLVLLTSLTFAVAAVRLARLGTLAQRLNAIESLAGVPRLEHGGGLNATEAGEFITTLTVGVLAGLRTIARAIPEPDEAS